MLVDARVAEIGPRARIAGFRNCIILEHIFNYLIIIEKVKYFRSLASIHVATCLYIRSNCTHRSTGPAIMHHGAGERVLKGRRRFMRSGHSFRSKEAEMTACGHDGGEGAGSRNMQGRARLAPWQIKIAEAEIAKQIYGRFNIDDVAASVRLSPSHFAKAFRNSVGVTPSSRFRSVRLAQTMTLLRESDLTITEIAVHCGFTDESHFSRSFTHVTGITPGKWRRTHPDRKA
ncbi:MAG: helix-turn-helix transcriptional regulator [Sphingobium sp.]|nr:helix-turn-helix transcriptional regulator [Sphingobium sp.]